MARLKKKIRVMEPRKWRDDATEFGNAKKIGANEYLIRIHPQHRTEKSRLNTCVHESLHCGDWDLSEKKVRHLTAVIVKVLWAQGYRRLKG